MIRVHRETTRKAGGCMACDLNAAHPAEVLVIHLRPEHGVLTTEIRLCDDCSSDMRRQIRERRPR